MFDLTKQLSQKQKTYYQCKGILFYFHTLLITKHVNLKYPITNSTYYIVQHNKLDKTEHVYNKLDF